MAAPQIAGAVAVMKEYIQKNIEKFDESSQGGKENAINGSFASSMNIDNIVEALLMSTANPQTQKDTYNTANGRELLYSPRKQGAGLADIGKALSTEAYLFNTNNEENQRPVINYGESEGGTFTQSFQLRNMSDESIRFALESIIETEYNISTNTRVIVNAPYRLNGKSTIEINSHNAEFVSGSAIGANVSPVSGCAIEIQPDSTVELTLTIELTDEDKKYINDNYPNGEFVEGYLKFKASSEHAVDLNIPFLGFYGLWGKAPILDTTLYEYNESGVIPIIARHSLSSFEMTRLIGIVPYTSPGILSPTLGKNFLSSSSDAYSKYISISPNGDGYYDQFVLAYCSSRNTTKTDCYIKLKDGTVVYEQHQGGSRKSTVIKGILRNNYITLDWDGTYNGNPIPNNTELEFEFKAYLDVKECPNVKDTLIFPIVIDTEKPNLEKVEVINNKNVIRVTGSDNNYLAGAFLRSLPKKEYSENPDVYCCQKAITNPEKGQSYSIDFYIDREHSKYELSLYDFARNEHSYEVDLNGNYVEIVTDTPTPTETPKPTNMPTPTEKVTPMPEEHSAQTGPVGPFVPLNPEVTETQPSIVTPTVTKEPEEEENVVATIAVTGAKTAAIEGESIEQALAKNHDVVIEVKEGGKVAYVWMFEADDYLKGVKLSDIKLGVTTKSGSESSYKNGVEVQFEQEGVLPMEAKVKINVGDCFKTNQTVYLYRKDEKTGKLLCVPFSTYTVAKDGTITLNVVQGDDYVILSKPAKSKDKITVANQIKVKKKVTCKKGETISVAAQLPATLVQVSSMKELSESADATFGAVVTYKVSNSKVATVDKDGKLVAKKAGKVTVTVKVKLSNGVTKTFQTKVTIK